MKKAATIGILLVVTIFASCRKERREKCEGDLMIAYEFDMPVSVAPVSDTIHLGDTLWVEMKLEHPTLNKLNGKRYDITKADLFLFFDIDDLLSPTVVPTASYIPLDENGEYLSNSNPDGDNSNKVTFKIAGDKCYWKRGFIITKKGLYMLGYIDIIGKSKQPHITKCPYEEVKFNYIINGDTTAEGNNYHFLQYSPDDNVGNWSSEQFRQSQYYAFCVN